jgi:hypothetical protein
MLVEKRWLGTARCAIAHQATDHRSGQLRLQLLAHPCISPHTQAAQRGAKEDLEAIHFDYCKADRDLQGPITSSFSSRAATGAVIHARHLRATVNTRAPASSCSYPLPDTFFPLLDTAPSRLTTPPRLSSAIIAVHCTAFAIQSSSSTLCPQSLVLVKSQQLTLAAHPSLSLH